MDVKASSENLNRMHVLPTPESLNEIILIINFAISELFFSLFSTFYALSVTLFVTYANEKKLKEKIVSFLCHFVYLLIKMMVKIKFYRDFSYADGTIKM